MSARYVGVSSVIHREIHIHNSLCVNVGKNTGIKICHFLLPHIENPNSSATAGFCSHLDANSVIEE